MKIFEGKTILITGGTGSLGKILLLRLLKGDHGLPAKILIYSRDEAKQHDIRLSYLSKKSSTDEVIYSNFQRMLEFHIGDMRDGPSLAALIKRSNIIINAAALKQVPTCEYFPSEAIKTNCGGAENIIAALRQHELAPELVIGVSTDKACHPVNVMGITKALQERILIAGAVHCPRTRFALVRYGNVLASRGSVVPLFHEQIKNGGPVTVTDRQMTRFLISLDQAVDTIFACALGAKTGEIFVPIMPSTSVLNLAQALIGKSPIEIKITGIRPGEKLHEVLVSEEEISRVRKVGNYYVIQPMLPELNFHTPKSAIESTVEMREEYSSKQSSLSVTETHALLKANSLLIEQNYAPAREEMLR